MSLQPGTQLGRYSIVSPLGAGGMGEVYRASDASLGREVAIKVLPEAVTAEEDRLTRFEREAKALAALNHPNIATLFGMERVELAGREQPFLVMELVEGPTLADRIMQGPMTWQEAARTFLEIAAALEAAHENGIVHRDLKPANVKIGKPDATGEARVKVLDFGLAKAMEMQAASGSAPGLEESPTLTLAATMRGEVLGTAGYMAPEQARGTAVDKRADVWAFGVCLFEALTGEGTFGGDTVSDKLASVLKDEPDWETLPTGLPPLMTGLLRRCLEKSVRVRLRDIGEARIVLAGLLADPEAAVAPLIAAPAGGFAEPERRPRWVAPLLAAAAFGLGALAMGLLGRDDGDVASPDAEPHESVRFSIGAADGGDLGLVGGMALSPNGRWLVYAGLTSEGGGLTLIDGEPPLRIRSLHDFDDSTRVLTGTEGALVPFFSSDSQWVGYLHGTGGQRTLFKVHVESGSIVQLTTGNHVGYTADWADDGRIVLGAARGALKWVTPDSDQLGEAFTALDHPAGELAHVNPEVLPGARGVLFTSIAANSAAPTIKVWDARSGEVRTVVSQGSAARYLASGHLIYGHEGDLKLIGFDLEILEVVGDPRIVIQGVRTSTLGEATFDVASDGTLVYLPGAARQNREMQLLWLSPDGSSEEVVASGDLYFPTISEDGRRWLAKTGDSELTLFELGAPAPLRFSTEATIHFPPFFLPGGREIGFGGGSLESETSLYRLNLGTGAVTVQSFEDSVSRIPIAVDADGSALLLVASPTGRPDDLDLGVGDLEGSGPHRSLAASPKRESFGKVSKDGTLLAWEEFAEATLYGGRVFVADYPEMTRRIAVGESIASMGYAWDREGRLFFTDVVSQSMRIASFSREPELRVSSVETAFRGIFNFWSQRSFEIAPDGRLLIVRGFSLAEPGGEDLHSGRFRVVLDWTRAEGLDQK
jgi:serine/threonine-protein kinase